MRKEAFSKDKRFLGVQAEQFRAVRHCGNILPKQKIKEK
jgi:hypothetical protein